MLVNVAIACSWFIRMNVLKLNKNSIIYDDSYIREHFSMFSINQCKTENKRIKNTISPILLQDAYCFELECFDDELMELFKVKSADAFKLSNSEPSKMRNGYISFMKEGPDLDINFISENWQET